MYTAFAYGILWFHPTFQGLVDLIDAHGELLLLRATSIVATWKD